MLRLQSWRVAAVDLLRLPRKRRIVGPIMVSRVLFPSQPYESRVIDPDFERERAVGEAAGLRAVLVDHTRVVRGEVEAAVSSVEEGPGLGIYRGWMLRPEQYSALYDALEQRGIRLINDVAAYTFCHQLPTAYSTLEGHTPRSVWLNVRGEVDFSLVHEVLRPFAPSPLRPFGTAPLIVKDFVKSQKHYWNEACYIRAASDRESVEAVTRRFLELQGEDLNDGLVFREFVPLQILGTHPKSQMRLGAELRSFWLDGELLLLHPYWADVAVEAPPEPPLAWLKEMAARIPSRLFTMDVALLADGTWTVMELGDGQVAGLPSEALLAPFYEGLRPRVGSTV